MHAVEELPVVDGHVIGQIFGAHELKAACGSCRRPLLLQQRGLEQRSGFIHTLASYLHISPAQNSFHSQIKMNIGLCMACKAASIKPATSDRNVNEQNCVVSLRNQEEIHSLGDMARGEYVGSV